MITREDIVEEARSWVGTKYHATGRLKGVGVDCAQFIYCVYNKFGLIPEMPAEARSPRFFLAKKDPKYLDTILQYARDIPEKVVQAVDLVLYKQSLMPVFHHGAIVISWPDTMAHAVLNIGVCFGHAFNEGFLSTAERRTFTFMPAT
jgi:cell wall-associated NlpC family hydrolase